MFPVDTSEWITQTWRTPPEDESQRITRLFEAQLTPCDPRFATAEKAIAVLPLPYYDSYQLCRVTDFSFLRPTDQYGFVGGDDLVLVDGTPLSTYKVNIKAPIRLSPESVGQYVLWYFRLWVKGDAKIVENSSFLWWDEDTAEQRDKFDQLAHLPRLVERDERGHYIVQITYFWQGTLFESLERVEPNGIVEEMPGSARSLLAELKAQG